jgi:hypothetical protein
MDNKIERNLEIERAVNILNSFGWVKTSEVNEDNKTKLTFEKLLQSPAVAESGKEASE